ncbi:MAG: RluA family pseudouridine synthase [Clostridia bacterium]|nr:RluA family pseudouridine synthase [Clostridia bacterium]
MTDQMTQDSLKTADAGGQEQVSFSVSDADAGDRLDSVLFSLSGGRVPSRSRAAGLIQEGLVRVNGAPTTKSGFRVKTGDRVDCVLPAPRPDANLPQDLPLQVLYQDDYLAVVVKPAGMVVHPAAGNPDGTLVNALLYHLDNLSGIGGEARPGIVHRLDKDTSGVMLVAKCDEAHLSLSAQWAEHTVEKHYRAVVWGHMKEREGRIDKPIARSKTDRKKMAVDPAGREAVTLWRVLEEYPRSTLLDVRILTGRTHQIRVHMASLGHPVLGDPIYGKTHVKDAGRLMLHAFSIAFDHPKTGGRMVFTAPCPFENDSASGGKG